MIWNFRRCKIIILFSSFVFCALNEIGQANGGEICEPLQDSEERICQQQKEGHNLFGCGLAEIVRKNGRPFYCCYESTPGYIMKIVKASDSGCF